MQRGKVQPCRPADELESCISPSDPSGTERDPSDLQNVHDDAEGPHVAGLVVLLRAQHLWGW